MVEVVIVEIVILEIVILEIDPISHPVVQASLSFCNLCGKVICNLSLAMACFQSVV